MNKKEILDLKKGPLKIDMPDTPKVSYTGFKKPEIPSVQIPKVPEVPTVKNGFESGNLKVRDAMTGLGFDNDKIGWDGKNVTYNNSYFLTPDENAEGITKTNPNTFIQAVNNSYKNAGVDDSVVGVTAYAAKNGKTPYTVTYGNGGVVMVGGVPIENAITIDGKAYAKRSSVEKAMNESRDISPNDMIRQYKEDNADVMDRYLDSINNYKEFSYNPEEDPAFLAYKKQYLDDAKEAYDDIYGLGVARTGGYANSAAMTNAAEAYFEHLSDLEDRMPDLAKFAYDRYADDFDRLINGLDMYGLPEDIYLMEYDANLDDLERADAASEADYERDWDNQDFSYEKYLDELEWEDELWERENITIPELMLDMEAAERDEVKDNLSIEKLLAEIAGKNIDNTYKRRKYGIK